MGGWYIRGLCRCLPHHLHDFAKVLEDHQRTWEKVLTRYVCVRVRVNVYVIILCGCHLGIIVKLLCGAATPGCNSFVGGCMWLLSVYISAGATNRLLWMRYRYKYGSYDS